MPARPSRPARPAPRPEDRLDLLSVVKGLAIGMILFLVLGVARGMAIRAAIPEAAKQAYDRFTVVDREVVTAENDQKNLQKAADDAARNNAPDAEARRNEADAKRADVDARKAERDRLVDEVNAAIPTGIKVLDIITGLLVTVLAAATAGYLAVQFTRGRRPAFHGLVAGMGFMVFYMVGGAVPASLAFLILQVGILAAGGWLGGQLWVKRHGPWDGTMPDRPARQPFTLFGRRPAPSDGEEPAVQDVDERPSPPARDRGEEHLEDDGRPARPPDGARQFGPQGKRSKRKRPSGPPAGAPREDDVE